MRVLITGANGFIGKNLQLHLAERKDIEVILFTRENHVSELPVLLSGIDFIFHLAGVNRSNSVDEFTLGNLELTKSLCTEIISSGRKIPILFTSSALVSQESIYGVSKRSAEAVILELRNQTSNPIYLFRLQNVFGKWCKPNYNSVVATFCNNIARNLPIQIHNADASLKLVYIDDVVERFIQLMDGADSDLDENGFEDVKPQYLTTVGELASHIESFKNDKIRLTVCRVGVGLLRALYSTYISYLPNESFSYKVKSYSDSRGKFVEFLKTADSGQISCITVTPGKTRGGHYHHTKTEKFLVINGSARFRFRHMASGESYEIYTDGEKAEIVETIPGWSHDITNIGTEEMIVVLWANELFSLIKPDTYSHPL
jgi:UDP-2-acetamido-2,6-beta-L-arabino-hexul-4-ose reductase